MMRLRGRQQTVVWSLLSIFCITITLSNLKILIDTHSVIQEFKRDKNIKDAEISDLKARLNSQIVDTNIERIMDSHSAGDDRVAQIDKTLQAVVPDPRFKNITSAELEKKFRNFYLYVTKKQKICTKLQYIGDKKILSKFQPTSFPVCMDEKYWKEEDKCLIYSYQIDNRWGFDDYMAESKKCEVHTFDANMYDQTDHVRDSGVNFHKFALGPLDDKSIYQRGKRDYLYRKTNAKEDLEKLRNIEMKTLKSTRKLLKHEKRILNVLRIDAEGPRLAYEFALLEGIVRSKSYSCIRQISLHLHFYTPLLPTEDDEGDKMDKEFDLITPAKVITSITELLKRLEEEAMFRICGATPFDTSGERVRGTSEFVEMLRPTNENITFTILLCNIKEDFSSCVGGDQ